MTKILPNIVVSKEELDFIKKNSNRYLSGAEGLIIRQADKRIVRKFFLPEICEEHELNPDDQEKLRESKLNKVIKLGTMSDLKNEVQVAATLTTENGTFIGYEMTSPDILYPLDTNPLLQSEKLEYLKILKQRLLNFHDHGVLIGDIKDSNILINRDSGIICFCDLDNAQIGLYPIDLMNYSIQRFADENGYIQEGADAYMFNVLTLNQIVYPHIDYREVIEKLKNAKPDESTHPEVKKILKKMKKNNTQYDGGYIIDYLRK